MSALKQKGPAQLDTSMWNLLASQICCCQPGFPRIWDLNHCVPGQCRVLTAKSTQISFRSPLAWALDEHLGIRETGFLETCTHMLKIPNCQEDLTTPYLLWRRQDRGEDNFSAFLPLNTEKSNFIRGARGAGYAWVSWTHARRAWICISSDAARLVLHRSSGKAWSREGSCLVQWHWSKHQSSGYMLSIPKAKSGLAEISGRWYPRKFSQKGTRLREREREKRMEVKEKRTFNIIFWNYIT